MNILSLFVLIPLLMLGLLWAARSLNQVRGVMVVGSTLLLALSVYLTIDYLAYAKRAKLLKCCILLRLPGIHL